MLAKQLNYFANKLCACMVCPRQIQLPVTKKGSTVSSTKLRTILSNKFLRLLFTSSIFMSICGCQVEPCTKYFYLTFAIKAPKMTQKLGDSICVTSNCIFLGHTKQAHNFFAKQFNYFASIKNLIPIICFPIVFFYTFTSKCTSKQHVEKQSGILLCFNTHWFITRNNRKSFLNPVN